MFLSTTRIWIGLLSSSDILLAVKIGSERLLAKTSCKLEGSSAWILREGVLVKDLEHRLRI